VTTRYLPLSDEAEVPPLLRRLAARTVITDVEPLIAPWDSGQNALDEGISRFLEAAGTVESVQVVCFATNSARTPSALPQPAGVHVDYLASARKPLRTAPYAALPVPGVVVGDQVPTDGMLAVRIGYTFLHFRPKVSSMPPGPRLLYACGETLRPLLFPRHVHSARRCGSP
jgi:predicted HAD superfamily phosphohydrolase YqeG